LGPLHPIASSLDFGLVAGLTATARRSDGAVAVLRRATVDRSGRRAASGLVAIEMALAVVLLIGRA
jgi:hypothetical protein